MFNYSNLDLLNYLEYITSGYSYQEHETIDVFYLRDTYFYCYYDRYTVKWGDLRRLDYSCDFKADIKITYKNIITMRKIHHFHYYCKVEFLDVLENVSPDIQQKLLFDLDIFNTKK